MGYLKKLKTSMFDHISNSFSNTLGIKRYSINTFPVRVIITGIEHSGTTLLSTLINQAPSLNSGFECGFLLADRPADYKRVLPWYEWMQQPVSENMWGLTIDNLDKICASKTWEEAYRRLIKYSPIFTGKIFQQVCDKTPRYLRCLDTVLDKLPDCVPCLVIEKELENLWRSHKKRHAAIEDFSAVYLQYNKGLQRALQRHKNRIHRISYEALCTNLNEQLMDVFSIVELPYTPEFATRHYNRIQAYYNRKTSELEPLTMEETDSLNVLKERLFEI